MLRRQQAEAVIAAREKIVLGAVSMVEMALRELARKNVVNLDEERKAAMVSNLLVVLCGTEEAAPVINTGTLYSWSWRKSASRSCFACRPSSGRSSRNGRQTSCAA